MGVGVIPRDDNGAPVLSLWNDATGAPLPIHVGSTVTGADGKTYAKLDTTASVNSGPTNITQISSANLGPTNGLPISGNNGGSLVVLDVDSSGRLILVPNTAFNMAQIAGVAPGLDNTNELRTSLYGKNAAAGDTPLLLDALGRPLIGNIVQIGGQAPKLDNTNELGVSMYGKNAAAGDTPLLLDSSGRPQINLAQYNGSNVGATNPIFTQDFIREQSILGHRWGVSTGKISTATNTNIYLVLDILINNIAKNILIDQIAWSCVNAQLDGRVNLTASTTLDTNATTDLIAGNNVINLQTAATNSSSLSVVKASSGNSAPAIGALLGTQATPSLGCPANQMVQLLQNGQVIYVPAGGVLQVLVYGVIATAGNNGYLYASWLEF